MFGINLVGETLQGHYYIKQKLGEGGFGETYLAEDKSKFDKDCVVKRLKPQNQSILRWVQQAFEQEARMLGNLGKHPQIPELLAYFQERQEFFLVQEFIDGDNLRQQFTSGVGWNENQVIFLLQSILEVLEFVHQHGVIHRDIKPENIIIRRKDGQILLIDFGAVKQTTTQVFNTQGQLTATTAMIVEFPDGTEDGGQVKQTMKVYNSSQGLVVLGFNPVDPDTRDKVDYHADNFLINTHLDGSITFINCDDGGNRSPVRVESFSESP